MLQQSMDFLSQYDPEVGASIREEFTGNAATLNSLPRRIWSARP